MEQTNTSGKDYGLYIEGHFVEPLGSARLPVINPATGETWATICDSLAPNMPFGGYKASGIGRENGLDALRSFTQTKSVWVELQPTVGDPFSVKL